ncbi:hypothetical protein B0H11DRAFT_2244137 [Mycena galericulata]|nr:hypothetical protein B0H11DRAFT_2244137 [Mycena galericulata]
MPTVTEARIKNLVSCLQPAIPLLNGLSVAFDTPFLQAISNTAQSLITAVQNLKYNKEDCVQLLESIYQILYAVVSLHIKSETTGNLPPAALYHVAHFTETLHKIHTFVEAQQEGNRIKKFFRQGEMNTLLKDCRAGIQQAVEAFKASAIVFIVQTILISKTY